MEIELHPYITHFLRISQQLCITVRRTIIMKVYIYSNGGGVPAVGDGVTSWYLWKLKLGHSFVLY